MLRQEQSRVSEIRAAFFQDPAADLDGLRETVAKSWIRSKKEKISPHRADFGRLDSQSFLAAHAVKQRPVLFDYIFSYLDSLYAAHDFSSTVLVLTDPAGRIINLYGAREELLALSQLGMTEECTLRESAVGTNAIGTCIYTREPVYIQGDEHYNDKLCRFITYGAPIFDHKNELSAVLGAISRKEGRDPLLLALITAVASSIGKECLVYHQAHSLIDQQNRLDTLINTMNYGIVFLDDQARIIKTNSVARYFFLMYEYELIGQHISTYISPEDVDFSRLTNNLYEQEVTVNSGDIKKFHFQVSVYIIKTGDQKKNFLLVLQKPAERKADAAADGSLAAKWRFNDIVGTSPALQETLNLARIASKTNCTVLITGESGTGKELIAQAIHNESKCKNGPFVAVNCGAIPKELIESELFGYESGAFTGAKKNGMPGKFEMANGGTIFLDEIGDMSFDLQVCLLRFLQEQEVTRIGGKNPIKVNVRVIAATNKNLEEAINNAVFRMDLYYRLNVFNIHVPPLRERTGDIGNLAHWFLQKFKCASNQAFVGFTPEALDAMQNYSWPGNIRELENTIERAVLIGRSDRIRLDDLPEKIRAMRDHHLAEAPGMRAAPARPPVIEPVVPMNIEEIEKSTILRALHSTGGNVTRAAQEIGISRRTLYRKMKKYDIGQ